MSTKKILDKKNFLIQCQICKDILGSKLVDQLVDPIQSQT